MHLRYYGRVSALLQVHNLTIEFPATHRRLLTAVRDLSFSIAQGEVLGLVGESGSVSRYFAGFDGLAATASGRLRAGPVYHREFYLRSAQNIRCGTTPATRLSYWHDFSGADDGA